MKDLYEEDSVSVINDGDTIKSFCSKYNVDGKHVITYINHLKDTDIRKDITTIEARGKRQNGHTRTSNGTPLLRVARSKS